MLRYVAEPGDAGGLVVGVGMRSGIHDGYLTPRLRLICIYEHCQMTQHALGNP